MIYNYDPSKQIPCNAHTVIISYKNMNTGKTRTESFIRVANHLFIDERGLFWTHGIMGFYWVQNKHAQNYL